MSKNQLILSDCQVGQWIEDKNGAKGNISYVGESYIDAIFNGGSIRYIPDNELVKYTLSSPKSELHLSQEFLMGL